MIDLRDVVEKYPECLENPTKFKNYLIDLYPNQEDQVQIRILSDIMRCGIVEEIKAGKTDSIAITHYRTVIESKYGYSSQLVLECISKWVSAFDPNVSYNSEYINENRTTENSIEDNDVVDLNLTPVEDTPVPTTNQKPNHHRQHGKMAKWIVAVLCLLCLVIIGVLTYNNQIIPEKQYNTAVEQLEQGNYQQAINEFEALNDYKDSADMILETKYKWAESLLADKAYDEAYAKFEEVKGYSDAADKMKDVRYAEAEEYLDKNGYQMAINLLGTLDGYKDSQVKVQEANYLWAEDYLQQGQFEEALTHFEKAGQYKDASARADELYEMMQLHATAVKLNKTSLTIGKGKTAELSATLEPADTTDTITSWTSSNEKVATVDKNGIVTAVDAGTATIEVKTTNGLTAKCEIKVSTPVIAKPNGSQEVSSGIKQEFKNDADVEMKALQVELYEGTNTTVYAYHKTTGYYIAESFSSSNPAVASVNAQKGWVHAESPGTAIITAKCEGGLTGSIEITVLDVTDRNIYYAKTSYNRLLAKLNPGESCSVKKITVAPSTKSVYEISVYIWADITDNNGNTASKTYMYNYRYSSPPYGDIESPAYYDGLGSFYDVTILDGNACSGKNVNIASVI